MTSVDLEKAEKRTEIVQNNQEISRFTSVPDLVHEYWAKKEQESVQKKSVQKSSFQKSSVEKKSVQKDSVQKDSFHNSSFLNHSLPNHSLQKEPLLKVFPLPFVQIDSPENDLSKNKLFKNYQVETNSVEHAVARNHDAKRTSLIIKDREKSRKDTEKSGRVWGVSEEKVVKTKVKTEENNSQSQIKQKPRVHKKPKIQLQTTGSKLPSLNTQSKSSNFLVADHTYRVHLQTDWACFNNLQHSRKKNITDLVFQNINPPNKHTPVRSASLKITRIYTRHVETSTDCKTYVRRARRQRPMGRLSQEPEACEQSSINKQSRTSRLQ